MRQLCCLALLLAAVICAGEPPGPNGEAPLAPPMLLQKEALEAGNPLATYAAMLDLETQYRNSKPLAAIYAEVRFNFEEFLGFPMAGVQAMSLPNFRKMSAVDRRGLPDGFEPEPALDVVEREVKKTRIVIWAEEHHLPQTRSLFEPLLRRLEPACVRLGHHWRHCL